jgi:hypothetical protein
MNKTLVLTIVASVWLCVSGLVTLAQPRPDFSGTWSLDLKKNGDVPTTLKSYLLTVKQDQQHITIDAKVEGDINPISLTDHTAPQARAIPLPTVTAFANPENVEDSFGGAHKIVQAPGRALALVIRHLNCTLDGKEMAREVGGLTPGQIRRKAAWRKGDKSLEINLIREIDVQGTKLTSTVREQWQLAEDGKVLKIKRTVNLLAGYDETTLIFNRQ